MSALNVVSQRTGVSQEFLLDLRTKNYGMYKFLMMFPYQVQCMPNGGEMKEDQCDHTSAWVLSYMRQIAYKCKHATVVDEAKRMFAFQISQCGDDLEAINKIQLYLARSGLPLTPIMLLRLPMVRAYQLLTNTVIQPVFNAADVDKYGMRLHECLVQQREMELQSPTWNALIYAQSLIADRGSFIQFMDSIPNAVREHKRLSSTGITIRTLPHHPSPIIASPSRANRLRCDPLPNHHLSPVRH